LAATPGPIEIDDPAERQHLLSVLRRRIDQVVLAGDYAKLEPLDQLYDRLNTVSHGGFDALTIRIAELRDRQNGLKTRKQAVEAEKLAKLKDLKTKHREKRAELVQSCDEALAKLRDECPSPDHPLYSRASRQLLDMRDDERRYARARDYLGARSLQQRADLQESEEHTIHERNWGLTCKRKKEQLISKNETLLRTFDDRYSAKVQAKHKHYDRLIEALAMMIQATTRSIQDLRSRTRRTDSD
jgi:hypothetical protein